MSYTLRVIFTGLVAFLPHKDGSEMDILFVRAPSKVAQFNGTVVPGHRPFVRFPTASLAGNNKRDLSLVIPDSVAHPGSEGVVFLRGEDFGINVGGSPPFRVIRNGVDDKQKQPDPGAAIDDYIRQKRDFGWTLQMGKVRPKFGDIDMACIKADKPKCLEAHMIATAGELQTLRLGGREGENEKSPNKVTIAKIPGTWRRWKSIVRAFAEEVALIYPTASGAITIKSSTFDGRALPDLVLREPACAGRPGCVFDIRIENIPLESLVEPHHVQSGAAIHFENYFKLLAKHPRRARPIPRPFSGGAGDRICPTLSLNPI
jgi:hypothetical protein